LKSPDEDGRDGGGGKQRELEERTRVIYVGHDWKRWQGKGGEKGNDVRGEWQNRRER
jgi:hypothetical protein